jgi:glycosyltransferase involved in cell wall biosynthesis
VPQGGSLGEAVQSAVQLDRRRVREAAVERFDYRRMVDAYERLYRRLTRPSDHAG